MEVVVAADSDERGLTLLRLWNSLRRFVLQKCSAFYLSYFKVEALTKSQEDNTILINSQYKSDIDIIPSVIDNKTQSDPTSFSLIAKEDSQIQTDEESEVNSSSSTYEKEGSGPDIIAEEQIEFISSPSDSTDDMPSISDEEIAKQVRSLLTTTLILGCS